MVVMEKTSQVIDALHKKYDDNAFSYAFLEQVANGTGLRANRHADAIAVQLWESRGLNITGFEIKVSRQDWVKELKHPEKAEPIAQYCHYWYLVCGDENIVQFGELPANWGLMVPHTKGTLKIVKEAPLNKNPKPVDMIFLCAVLRQTQNQLTDTAKLQAKYHQGYTDGKEDGKKDAESNVKYWRESRDELQKTVKEFEDISGIGITQWRWNYTDSQKIAQAVKIVLDGTYLNNLRELKRMQRISEEVCKNVSEAILKLEEKGLDTKEEHVGSLPG